MIQHPNLKWYFPFDRDFEDKSGNGINLSIDNFRMELGSIAVSDTFDANGSFGVVTFQNTYRNPIVVTFRSTANGTEEIVTHARNITNTGCEIVMYEPDKEGHTTETVTYLVVERGVWELPDGTIIEAGIVTNVPGHAETENLPSVGKTQQYAHTKSSNPVVLADIQTDTTSEFKTAIVDSGYSSTEILVAVSVLGSGLAKSSNNDVGFICFDSANTTTTFPADSGNIKAEWGSGNDGSNDGLDDTPHTISYQNSYSSVPVGVVRSQNSGDDGHFTFITTAPTSSSIDVYAAEDPIGDVEQSHTDLIFSWFFAESSFSVNQNFSNYAFADGPIANAIESKWNTLLGSNTVEYTPSDQIGNMTVFFWGKIDAPRESGMENTSYTNISIAIAGYDRSQWWSVGSDRVTMNGNLSFNVRGSLGSIHDVESSIVFDNTWHHYAITYTLATGEIRFYEDGILKDTIAALSVGEYIGDTSLASSRALTVLCTNEHDPSSKSYMDVYDPFMPGWKVQHLGYLDGTVLSESDIKRVMVGLSPLST